METRHLVDPALLPTLETFPVAMELSLEVLPAVRARGPLFPPPEGTGTSLRVFSTPGPRGAPEVQLYVYRPEAATGLLPCIYHMHGGGYVARSARDIEYAHRPLAAELNCVIVSVEYRLAPETCFPGNIEDCYAGLAWTVAHASELGIDSARLGVMGESAGGGLAAALALLARDRGEYRLSFQQLIYPMLDDRTCTTPEPNPFAGQFIWGPHNNHFGWSALLGHEPGMEGVSPYAAPARAEDLTGLPPTFISTGALDIFVDENIEYARRLIRAGVPTELVVYPGAFHGFDLIPGPEVAERARRDSRAALKRFMSA
jgi:triacylglycerol lipase